MILTSIGIFLLYVLLSFIVFKKVPPSLSNTYYMYEHIHKYLKFLFPIMMFLVAGLLLPAWLEVTSDSIWQFLSFLTCASIMFVGAVPNFKSIGIESTIHTVAAIFAAVCSILWSILVVGCWLPIIGWLIIFISIAGFTKTLKSAYIFWLEMVAFFQLFTTLIIYLFI